MSSHHKPTGRNVILSIEHVKKVFKHNENQPLLVLDDVNLTLHEGEIIALLGRSGSGKSTLLRIIAGLIRSDGGQIFYRDKPITRPVAGISMVFQHFALMPWLTVLQNVELGLEALGVDRQQRRQRALKAIDTIGLDGFESAFPRELSGGMRQRVGFARALVVNPEIFLMDEPFSALDVLTAENLRNDLLGLWHANRTRNCILLVTHDIEEAVLMADRVIVFDSNPGRVLHDLAINLPHPRDEETPGFRHLVDQIYRIMTGGRDLVMAAEQEVDLGYRLPDARISELVGFVETLLEEDGDQRSVELSKLDDILHYDINELFPLVEVLEILQFTKQADAGIRLTDAGRQFAKADMLARKKIFAHHLLTCIPLIKHIRTILAKKLNHRASKKYFIAILEDYLSQEDAERVMRVVIEWGRYAELFAYNDGDGKLSLENPK